MRSILTNKLRRTGSAATEYAIILAIVVGVTLVASRYMSGQSKDVFARVFSGVNSESQNAQAADVSGNRQEQISEQQSAEQGISFFDARLLAAEAVAFAALTGLLYALHTMRKRKELLGEDDEVPKAICSTCTCTKPAFQEATGNLPAAFWRYGCGAC